MILKKVLEYIIWAINLNIQTSLTDCEHLL